MAATWRALSLATAYASGKHMIDLAAESDYGRVSRVRRLYHFNNGTGSVTGVLTEMRVNRVTTVGATAPTGGSTVTPIAHDTNSSALSNITAGTGRTLTVSAPFRKYIWSNDEPAVSGASMDEWELFVPFATVFEAGYGDSNVEPIVCRPTFGVCITQQGTSAVGSADLEIEFTDEAS